jgi:hypothetical protein
VSLIQFLLDKGANPNIVFPFPSTWEDGDAEGTIFDHFADYLLEDHFSRDEVSRRITIRKRLEAAGSAFSKPLNGWLGTSPYYLYKIFAHQVKHFTIFEDQIDCKLYS